MLVVDSCEDAGETAALKAWAGTDRAAWLKQFGEQPKETMEWLGEFHAALADELKEIDKPAEPAKSPAP